MTHNYKNEEKLDYVNIFMTIIKCISYKYLFALRVKRNYQIYYINIVMNFSY